ncbi:MAG: OB-fold nucleic acid binding domain-containing protein [Nitrospiraceae bacterium]
MTEEAWNRCKDLRKQCYNARVIVRSHISAASLSALVALLWPAFQVQAIEPTQVQDILGTPSAYHLRQAALQGTVRNVQALDPYETPAGTVCYGAYLFQLEDDTGVIAVAVPGLCGVPLVKDPDVQDGDRVFVEATIQTPSHGGYSLSLKGLKITTEQEGTVQAVATRITPLAE